ncbi:MAG: rRNA pseudouridine synthase [Pseudomonadales bacterium]|nr:rRNA pseudouridine synthase [Pseudomonadales bacterium]MCP5182437.1 rRNA pseudouridine synthase [Pseudomonadales bacterium]
MTSRHYATTSFNCPAVVAELAARRTSARAARGGERSRDESDKRASNRRVTREPSSERGASRRSPAAGQVEEPVRLQKYLADAGMGSRREIEGWITHGRVLVNGEPATLGVRVTQASKILIDGKPFHPPRARGQSRVLLLNKAAGTICTRHDPEGRPTVFEDLPSCKGGRWILVGRLDAMTSGLLLVTDDGELANKLMHPSSLIDREYAVRVDGILPDEEIARLRQGVEVEGEFLRFTDLAYYDGRGRNHWYHGVLMEGKQHEVKLLFAAVNRVVSRLKRVRFGPVALPSRLAAGRYEEMSETDVVALRRLVGLAADVVPTVRQTGGKRERKSVLLPYPDLATRSNQFGHDSGSKDAEARPSRSKAEGGKRPSVWRSRRTP